MGLLQVTMALVAAGVAAVAAAVEAAVHAAVAALGTGVQPANIATPVLSLEFSMARHENYRKDAGCPLCTCPLLHDMVVSTPHAYVRRLCRYWSWGAGKLTFTRAISASSCAGDAFGWRRLRVTHGAGVSGQRTAQTGGKRCKSPARQPRMALQLHRTCSRAAITHAQQGWRLHGTDAGLTLCRAAPGRTGCPSGSTPMQDTILQCIVRGKVSRIVALMPWKR